MRVFSIALVLVGIVHTSWGQEYGRSNAATQQQKLVEFFKQIEKSKWTLFLGADSGTLSFTPAKDTRWQMSGEISSGGSNAIIFQEIAVAKGKLSLDGAPVNIEKLTTGTLRQIRIPGQAQLETIALDAILTYSEKEKEGVQFRTTLRLTSNDHNVLVQTVEALQNGKVVQRSRYYFGRNGRHSIDSGDLD